MPHAGGELPENNLTAEIQEKTVQLRFAWVAFFVTAAVFLSPVRGRPAAAPEDPAWNKVVAAAKKEAKVVIIGPLGSEVRDAYTIGFQKKYPEIEVDFSGMRGAEVAPKLLAELNAKHYLTDIAVAGTTTALVSLVPASAVVPYARPFCGSLKPAVFVKYGPIVTYHDPQTKYWRNIRSESWMRTVGDIVSIRRGVYRAEAA